MIQLLLSMLSNNKKYLLNSCNNIAHLCLRASQSLFIQRRLHARVSESEYRGGGYGGVDSGVGDTGYSGVDLGRQILLTSNNY